MSSLCAAAACSPSAHSIPCLRLPPAAVTAMQSLPIVSAHLLCRPTSAASLPDVLSQSAGHAALTAVAMFPSCALQADIRGVFARCSFSVCRPCGPHSSGHVPLLRAAGRHPRRLCPTTWFLHALPLLPIACPASALCCRPTSAASLPRCSATLAPPLRCWTWTVSTCGGGLQRSALVLCDFGPSFEVLDVDGAHVFLQAEQRHAWAAAGSDLACLAVAVA